MYCWLCGGTAATTCASCSRRVCASHCRRWFRVTFCTRCHSGLPSPWAVGGIGLTTVLAAALYFWRS